MPFLAESGAGRLEKDAADAASGVLRGGPGGHCPAAHASGRGHPAGRASGGRRTAGFHHRPAPDFRRGLRAPLERRGAALRFCPGRLLPASAAGRQRHRQPFHHLGPGLSARGPVGPGPSGRHGRRPDAGSVCERRQALVPAGGVPLRRARPGGAHPAQRALQAGPPVRQRHHGQPGPGLQLRRIHPVLAGGQLPQPDRHGQHRIPLAGQHQPAGQQKVLPSEPAGRQRPAGREGPAGPGGGRRLVPFELRHRHHPRPGQGGVAAVAAAGPAERPRPAGHPGGVRGTVSGRYIRGALRHRPPHQPGQFAALGQ